MAVGLVRIRVSGVDYHWACLCVVAVALTSCFMDLGLIKFYFDELLSNDH